MVDDVYLINKCKMFLIRYLIFGFFKENDSC